MTLFCLYHKIVLKLKMETGWFINCPHILSSLVPCPSICHHSLAFASAIENGFSQDYKKLPPHQYKEHLDQCARCESKHSIAVTKIHLKINLKEWDLFCLTVSKVSMHGQLVPLFLGLWRVRASCWSDSGCWIGKKHTSGRKGVLNAQPLPTILYFLKFPPPSDIITRRNQTFSMWAFVVTWGPNHNHIEKWVLLLEFLRKWSQLSLPHNTHLIPFQRGFFFFFSFSRFGMDGKHTLDLLRSREQCEALASVPRSGDVFILK